MTCAALVTQDGSGSSDPNGGVFTYAWGQTSGPLVLLSDPSASQPTFTAPQVTAATPLVFSLVVSDANGSSSPSTVTVTVSPPPSRGADLTSSAAIIALVTAPQGQGSRNLEVIRDGVYPPIRSTDPSTQYDTFTGTKRTEDWIGYQSASPQTFGELVAQGGIQFSNGGWFDTVSVQVRQNGVWLNVPGVTVRPPYAGNDNINFETYTFDFPAVTGDAIRLDGRPGGFDNFISIGELRVFQGSAGGVAVPTAVAGTDQNALSLTLAQLDGSHSSDPTAPALMYAWTQVSGPAVVFSDVTAVNPTFTVPAVDAPTPLVLSLSVANGAVVSPPSTVTVTAMPRPHPGPDLTAGATIIALVTTPAGGGSTNLEVIRDGVYPPIGSWDTQQQYDTFTGQTRTEDWIGYEFASPQTFAQLVFQDGIQFGDGGWFTSINVQVRQGGAWVNIPGVTVTPAYAGNDNINFETYSFDFPPITADAIRIDGTPGGDKTFISVGELRVYAASAGGQDAGCTGSAPVNCAAQDQCHVAGTCDPATGACSNPTAPNGTACNDGNACTQSDTCQAGTCVGANPVACAASDQCHAAGVCDSTSGICSNPSAANGTACNDGNACTLIDTCQSGSCVGSNPVLCTATDQCHVAGTCNSTSGACSNPAAADGTMCAGTNKCSQAYACMGGTCTGSNPVACAASDQCHTAGTCDPSTGACSTPAVSNGTACNDGNACTQTDACQNGSCTGANPVTCAAGDQCHVAGTCDPTTGACSNPAASDGTACTGSNKCNQSYACAAGTCTGSNPVTCTASDACHTAGTCDPMTGACSNPAVADGTPCIGTNKCNQSYVCTGGTCRGSNPVVCAASQCGMAGVCDPATGTCSAPSQCNVDRTVASNLFQTTAFLYTGSSPLQTGVAVGTIVATRAAVVRGHVHTTGGVGLQGVSIAVLNHPEFGTTLSQGSGEYDLAVNGGGLLTLTYSANGFSTVHRTMPSTPWNDFVTMPDVTMTQLDTASTTVNVANPPNYQVHRATTVTDSSGTRTATLLIPPGTQAMINGNPVSSLTVRATELTVGNTGPSAMPATLPANSGYTYCFDLTADEALASGGTVTFNAPILSYIDDFLHFPAGQHVPLGYYDRTQGQWVPVKDGLVITIVSISGGAANIDIDGDGVADSPPALSAVGITSAEQMQLAAMYPSPPTSLWRLSIPHFSLYDPNWPFGPVAGAAPPPGPKPGRPAIPRDPCRSGGQGGSNASTIECRNGILHETIPIAGTPYSLVYASDRVAGYTAPNRLIIPLSGATLPNGVVQIVLEVDVGGRTFTQTFAPMANLTTTFDWDGNDAYGRPMQGVQTANVSVGYVYQGVYFKPGESPNGASYDALFGHFSWFGTPATGDRARQTVTLWERAQSFLGHWSAEPLGLGGWTLDVQHAYDPKPAIVNLGNGDEQPGSAFGHVITTVAGTGVAGFNGDGMPALSTQINGAWDVNVAPDGTLFITDKDNQRIRKIDSHGNIVTVAGTGGQGYNGDNIPATQATLSLPENVQFGPDGSFYIADIYNERVRKVDPNGRIHTVAGNGNTGYSGDGLQATSASFNHPSGMAVAPDGTLYIADALNNCVRKVDPGGIVSTVLGVCTQSGFNGDGQPAAKTLVNIAFSLALSPDGVLYFSDTNNHRVRAIGVDGIVRTIAGTGTAGFFGDEGPATQAKFNSPEALALARDGTLYVMDRGNVRIRAIRPDGIITTVAGTGATGFTGDNGPAFDAPLQPGLFVSSMGLSPDGLYLYVGHGLGTTQGSSTGDRVRRISFAQPGFTNTAFSVAASDGSEVYGFDALGRHLGTKVLPTGGTRLALGYNSSGQVITLTDGNNNVTTIRRDGSGHPTAIVSPFGVKTSLGLGSDGYLSTVTDPTGALYQMAYTTGLLTAIQFPTGSSTVESTKTYDSLGRVLTSTDAAGGSFTFARAADALASIGVIKTSSMNVATGYTVSLLPSGATTWTNNLPGVSGAQVEQLNADGSRTVTYPDGSVTTYQAGPDPRFGMQVPIAMTQTTKLPISGVTNTTTMSRTVTLSNASDPLSLTAQTDTTVVNGQTWTRAFSIGPPAAWTATSPVGRTTTTQINSLGQPTQIAVPNVNPFSFAYDSHGRLQTMTQAARSWQTGYDANGYPNSQTDPMSHTVSSLNDLAGRPLTTTLADLRQVGTRWDGDGNMQSITLAGNTLTTPDPARQHQFSFTPVDLTKTYTPPSIGIGQPSTTYSYDADRFLKSIARPDGVTVTHVPDASERLSQITYPQGTLLYGYSPATGQLTTTTTPGGEVTTIAYDGFLTKNITWSGPVAGSVGFAYNADFRVSAQTIGSATAFPFGYDADGLLVCAGASSCPASGALSVAFDLHNGSLTATTLGNVTDSYSYDPNGLFASYAAKYNGAPLYTETIVSRYADSRIHEKTDTFSSTTHDWIYVYDPTGRLTDVTEDAVAVSHYGYDGDDNRTTVGVGTPTQPTYDAHDRLLTYPSLGASYAYTANGELLTKTTSAGTTNYTYDALGDLLHVGLPAALPDGVQTVDYVVDGQNRRVGRKINGASTITTGWLYQDQLRVVAQLDGSNNVVERFVYGSKPNVPDYVVTFNTSGTALGTFRILSDHLGSPRLVVDISNGNVVETMSYDEFGNETESLTSPPTGYVRIPFGFSGGLYDPDTGLVRFGARDYDASVGRWTSKDPIRFGGGQVNLYVYAGNDPIDQVDRTGNDSTDPCSGALPKVLCAESEKGSACKERCQKAGIFDCEAYRHAPYPGPAGIGALIACDEDEIGHFGHEFCSYQYPNGWNCTFGGPIPVCIPPFFKPPPPKPN